MKKIFCRMPGVLVATALLSAASPLVYADFSADDVHFRIGSGTNKAVFIADWNYDSAPASLVWEFRWNGSAFAADMFKAVAAEDRRFHVYLPDSQWGISMDFFAYDRDGDGGAFDSASGTATDSDDFTGKTAGNWYWALGIGAASSGNFSDVVWSGSSLGAGALEIENGRWYSVKYVDWSIDDNWNDWNWETPAEPLPAESPYAFEVVDLATGCTDVLYNDSSVVLGRPLAYMNFAWGGVVNPANPAWGGGSICTLQEYLHGGNYSNGFITVKFDHRIIDDALNPYGLDFIVFGNAFQYTKNGSYYSDSTDPASVVFADGFLSESGLVEVSQDGVVWYSYTNGPWADDFAPTLGHMYDTNSPETSLYAGNLWWGKMTDATLPVDPSLSSSDFNGKTLAEYATLYNGSAGGTGFDISRFGLPADENGRKWIQYVRIVDSEGNTTEVDAISDVSPDLPYDKWMRDNYTPSEIADKSVSGKSAVAANSKPNYVNAAFGISPMDDAPTGLTVGGISVSGGKAALSVPGVENAFDSLRICTSTNLSSGEWTETIPVWNGSESGSGMYSADADADAMFFKVKLVE